MAVATHADPQRGIVVDTSGNAAVALMQIGTLNGAQSLGLPVGTIAPGAYADFMSVDLSHPCMRGCDEHSILDGLLLGCGNGAVDQAWIGGTSVPRSRT